jgi:hypothetical protein
MTLNTFLARPAIMNDELLVGNKPLLVSSCAVLCVSLQQLLPSSITSMALIWPLATWRSGEYSGNKLTIGMKLDVSILGFGKILNAIYVLWRISYSREKCDPRKKRRNALIALAQRYGWEIGYLDEVWWSRLSQPNLHSWSEKDEPLRLQELSKNKNDPDPKSLACYGMLSAESGRMHLRFVSGRPVSQVTTDFLEWLCEQVQAQGKSVLVLIWDNASWHVSKQVRTWLREHNHAVLQDAQTGKAGVRIIPCWLPTKSPWLNKIEPKWVHGKRAIVEPARLLTAKELKQRVYDYFGCELLESLVQKGS